LNPNSPDPPQHDVYVTFAFTFPTVDNVNPAITREHGFYLEFVVNGFSPMQKSPKGWLDGDQVMFGEEGEENDYCLYSWENHVNGENESQ